jgi:hypothetical protein
LRLRIESARPVLDLAVDRDGSTVLARLEPGELATVDIADAGGLHPLGSDALLPSRPWPASDGRASLGAPIGAPPATAEPVAETVTSPGPEVAPSGDERPETGDDSLEPAISSPPVAQPPSEPAPREPAPPEPAAPREPSRPGTGRLEPVPEAQVSGAIGGLGERQVAFVVLLGPDNILREARRLRPGANGRWRVDGLPPGRYRIQIAGEGGGVLVTDPPFHVVDVVPEVGSALKADFRVLGSR